MTVRIGKLAIGITIAYLILVAVAFFDHLGRKGLSNEGGAGLSLLAHIPAIPASLAVNWGLDAVGLAGLLAPFESGISNVVWVAAIFWALALAQWCWLFPLLRRLFGGGRDTAA